jgi:hypothetical protein
VNGADVVSLAGGHRSIGEITEDDGVDLGWIIFLVGSRSGSGCGAGGTGSAGTARGEMCMFGVTQGMEDRGEHSDGGDGSEQDGSGAERLAADDIEAGGGESGDAGGEGWLHGWSLGVPGASRVGGGPTGLAATLIVDGLPKGGVSAAAFERSTPSAVGEVSNANQAAGQGALEPHGRSCEPL